MRGVCNMVDCRQGLKSCSLRCNHKRLTSAFYEKLGDRYGGEHACGFNKGIAPSRGRSGVPLLNVYLRQD